jgi:hypothetical protein
MTVANRLAPIGLLRGFGDRNRRGNGRRNAWRDRRDHHRARTRFCCGFFRERRRHDGPGARGGRNLRLASRRERARHRLELRRGKRRHDQRQIRCAGRHRDSSRRRITSRFLARPLLGELALQLGDACAQSLEGAAFRFTAVGADSQCTLAQLQLLPRIAQPRVHLGEVAQDARELRMLFAVLTFLDAEQPVQQRRRRKELAAAMVDARERVQRRGDSLIRVPELLRFAERRQERLFGFVELLFGHTPASNLGERLPTCWLRLAHGHVLPLH